MKRIFIACLLVSLSTIICAQTMPCLHRGDTIAIAAPSGKVEPSQVLPAVQYFQSQGFNVIVSEDLYENYSGFAGTVSQRVAQMQALLDRPGVKAIVCARGGYGAVSLLDSLDFTMFKKYPKWICGFSDITAFHSHLHTLGYPSLHSVMTINIWEENMDNEYHRSLIKALRCETLSYDFDSHPANRPGKARAILVGGNLSLLYSMLESVSSINTDGKILFIEDVGENIYHIERMLVALDRAGKLKNLKGLIVGSMNKIKIDDYYYDSTIEDVILGVCGKYNYPICFDFPAGHDGKNVALRLGRLASLVVTTNQCHLTINN
jgi:muramoyltetrapeptide carboxypeptidase